MGKDEGVMHTSVADDNCRSRTVSAPSPRLQLQKLSGGESFWAAHTRYRDNKGLTEVGVVDLRDAALPSSLCTLPMPHAQIVPHAPFCLLVSLFVLLLHSTR